MKGFSLGAAAAAGGAAENCPGPPAVNPGRPANIPRVRMSWLLSLRFSATSPSLVCLGARASAAINLDTAQALRQRSAEEARRQRKLDEQIACCAQLK